jgi:hypothetical protein
MADLKTRYVGTCPVCEKEFKLFGDGVKTLVHHGYQRPGDGFIVGDCFAVKYEPYEVSTKGCEDYRVAIINERGRLEDYLERLEGGKIRKLSFEKYRGYQMPPEIVSVSVDSEDPAERAKFERVLKDTITQTRGRIHTCDHEVERMGRRIAAWVLKPIRTFEESMAEQAERTKAEREARAAERQAKRDAKAKKRAEIDAKNKAREDERLTLIAKYKALFESLANGLESVHDRKLCARHHWVDMCKALNKKAYLHFYGHTLECDDALVTLDLAKRTEAHGRPWTVYANEIGVV